MPIGRKGREEEEKFLTRSLVTRGQRADERADIFFRRNKLRRTRTIGVVVHV